jgi:hypothetical protein
MSLFFGKETCTSRYYKIVSASSASPIVYGLTEIGSKIEKVF